MTKPRTYRRVCPNCGEVFYTYRSYVTICGVACAYELKKRLKEYHENPEEPQQEKQNDDSDR